MSLLDPKYKKVQHVNRPLVKGEFLWVPCVTGKVEVHTPHIDIDLRDFNFDVITGKEIITITPILWPMHDGHYHADMRFVRIDKHGQPIRTHRKHFFTPHNLMNFRHWEHLEYILLPVIEPNFKRSYELAKDLANIIGAEDAVIDVKIKYPSIKKGKCPHKGFNLAQVKPDSQGEIICPMHGLTFKCKHLQKELA